ncbi:hypothetical protein JB92DRAFT_1729105 [Gautieria morchelliformis]|nr:hypothetical protein JB92DRAFT_1729105 [Gautieria morchelliformis]
MSAGSQRPPSGSTSRAAEMRGGRSLATYPTPSQRESLTVHDTVSRYHATQPESRNDPADDGYIHSNGSSRRHSTDSHAPQQQAVAGASRRYHMSPPQQLEPTNPQSSQQNSHQRPPNLSLDTRNLSNPRPSPFTPSRPAENSPPADPSSMLYADLASLKSRLEALWTHSSNKLHTLHHTISTQSETLRSLSITNATLESMAQQHAVLSQEVERLGGENSRLIKEVREAEEARTKALREREMLGEANARLWEDKARLEGEKRELRVKLDAEVDFARLCQRELEKGDDSRTTRSGIVKLEENDEERTDDGLAEIRVPLVHVEDIIKKRIQRQADDFTRAADEVYGKLALSQTRVTELEAQIKRYSVRPTLTLAEARPPCPRILHRPAIRIVARPKISQKRHHPNSPP